MSDEGLTSAATDTGTPISDEALKRWATLDDGQILILPMSKKMVDDLLLSMRQSIVSTSHLSAALQHYTNGKNEEAQAAFNEHLVTLDHAWQRVNRLANSIMLTAHPVPDNAHG